MKLSKLPHSITSSLNIIADKLWNNKTSIMVGAGFSKNSKRDLPDWNALGITFFKELYGRKPGSDEHFLNPIQLAEEYEKTYNEKALNDLLKSQLDVEGVEPSELHKKLVTFPWNDIFTTNYDTLIDKANELNGNSFALVETPEVLPDVRQPRLIKLHGSFPHSTPFIITEEHYRTYPKRYAPFINTVQQALIEDCFCLIGFSATDPNFLEWIGWVRDHLGKDNIHKMFLIGIFDLTDGYKQLLHERNIKVVNFAEVQGLNGDHSKALELFLNYLEERRSKEEIVEIQEIASKNDGHQEDALRKYLEAATVLYKTNTKVVIAPQEYVDIYFNRDLWTFSQEEIDYLSHSFIKDNTKLVPGWYWFKIGKEPIINIILNIASTNPDRFLRMSSLTLLIDKVELTEEQVDSLLKFNMSYPEVIVIIFKLLSKDLIDKKIDWLKKCLDHISSDYFHYAIDVYIESLYRKDPFNALKYALEEANLIPAFMQKTNRLEIDNDETLREYLIDAYKKNNQPYRFYIVKLIVSHGFVDREIASLFIQSTEYSTKKEAILFYINEGEIYTLDDLLRLFSDLQDQPRMLFNNKSKEELLYDDFIYPQLAKKDFEELVSGIDFLSTNCEKQYEVLLDKYWDKYKENALANMQDCFDSLLAQAISAELIKLKGSADKKDSTVEQETEMKKLLDESTELLKRVSKFVKRKLISVSLNAFGKHPDSRYLDLAREYLDQLDFYKESIVACLTVIRRHGDSSDCIKIKGIIQNEYGEVREDAIKTLLVLSDNKTEELSSMLIHENSEIIKETLKVILNDDFDCHVEMNQLMSLMRHKSDDIRSRAFHCLLKFNNKKSLDELLIEYYSKPGEFYYYDIVREFDEALYGI